jgi:hypothetical protein
MRTEEERVRGLMRQMHETAENTTWSVTADQIRSQRRRRIVRIPVLTTIALVAAAVLLIAVLVEVSIDSPGNGSARVAGLPGATTTPSSSTTTTAGGAQRVTVPNLVGLSQAQAVETLATVGLTVNRITLVPSTSGAGRVVSEQPSSGSRVAQRSSVTISVSNGESGSAAPTVPFSGTQCASGQVSYVDSNGSSGSICLRVGARLTVTFISSGGWSGYGQWSSESPTISNNSVLAGGPYGFSGKKATAVFTAVGVGTATATAFFDVSCAPANTTPCTVPPLATQAVTVTVVTPA